MTDKPAGGGATLFALILACIAVLASSFQAYLGWRARNAPVEAAAAAALLEVCADAGATAAEIAAQARLALDEFSPETFEPLRAAPRQMDRLSRQSSYLLPQGSSEDVALMAEVAQRIVGAASARDREAMTAALADFDAASARVQAACRERLLATPYY